MKVRSRFQQWLQSQERQSPVMFILRKERSPSEAEITDHMPEEGSISLMFTAEKTRPVESGWEIKSGGHIYMFVLPSVAVILFPTDTITSRFSFPAADEKKAPGSSAAAGRLLTTVATRASSTQVFIPRAGPKHFRLPSSQRFYPVTSMRK